MSEYYLGDPCYVIPDAEWADFCNIMLRDGYEFEYKGESCVVIGTGGDGDFGGLSVDTGIIGIIPVSLCDPQSLKDTVPNHARLIDFQGELESRDCGVITLDGEPLNGYECGCGCGEVMAEGHEITCGGCGEVRYYGCVEYRNDEGYCGEGCMPSFYCEVCGDDDDGLDESNRVCDDCNTHSMCGCPKDDPYNTDEDCEDCKIEDEEE